MTNPLREAVGDALDQARDGDGRESIDNRERGCGHLKPNSAYVRSDVAALSGPDGEVPVFVELDDPVEYREHNGKGAIIPGYVAFPGTSFDLHYRANGGTTSPEGDVEAHHERLSRYGFDGKHYGEITSARASDLLMSIGKTNWETPQDFVDETLERGLNLKIPVSDRQAPPPVEPLRTRVWVIHPHGCGEDRPGIIGYAYLTRTVFTTGTKASSEDPDIPAWAQDYADAGKFDVVDRGKPISADDAERAAKHVPLSEFDVDDADDVDDFAEAESAERPDTATITVADDDAPGDVSGIEVQFGRGDVPVTKRRDTFENATDDGLPYNALKIIAAKRDDVDVGSTPSEDDLITGIVDDAYGYIPAYADEPTDDKPIKPGAN